MTTLYGRNYQATTATNPKAKYCIDEKLHREKKIFLKRMEFLENKILKYFIKNGTRIV